VNEREIWPAPKPNTSGSGKKTDLAPRRREMHLGAHAARRTRKENSWRVRTSSSLGALAVQIELGKENLSVTPQESKTGSGNRLRQESSRKNEIQSSPAKNNNCSVRGTPCERKLHEVQNKYQTLRSASGEQDPELR
jgi:hypothetical protein